MVKLSIIIPSYNDGKNVLKLVGQIKKQKLSKTEIIVVESGDGDYGRKLKGVEFFKSRKGRARQMNLGARKSRGGLLFFLHADSDISRIELSKLEKISSDEFWGCFKIRFDTDKAYFRFIEFTSNFRKVYLGLPFGDQGFVVSKKLFNEAHGFLDGGFEDLDLSRKLLVTSKPSVLEGEIIASPRRFMELGIVRTHFIMSVVFYLYLAKLRKTAVRFYQAHS